MKNSPEKPIILCYDDSENAKLAIDRAGKLFGGKKARVLCVLETWAVAAFERTEEGVLKPREVDAELHVPGLETAHRTAHAGTERARSAGLDAEPLVHLAPGKTWEGIVDVAEEFEAEVVVIGARGRSAVGSMLLGSTSDGVVHHCRQPVLVVRGPEESKRQAGDESQSD